MKPAKRTLILLFLLFISVALSACSQPGINQVTAEYILNEDMNADIIQEHSSIFENVKDIWSEEEIASYNFSKDELQGEIQQQTTEADNFVHLTATHLPVETKIFSANSDDAYAGPGVLIAEVDGQTFYYQKIVLE